LTVGTLAADKIGWHFVQGAPSFSARCRNKIGRSTGDRLAVHVKGDVEISDGLCPAAVISLAVQSAWAVTGPLCNLNRIGRRVAWLSCGRCCNSIHRGRFAQKAPRFVRTFAPAFTVFRASFVHLARRRAASLFSYAKPNKQVRVFAATSFDGYEPEGREFESPRAHHFNPCSQIDLHCSCFLLCHHNNLSILSASALEQRW
jgi:hypothetical protein